MSDIKKYYFSEIVAKDTGVEEAIMLSNLYFWVQKNEENQHNEMDGKYWTYNTVREFVEQYPFWTSNQIRRILDNLEDKRYIETGSFNKKGYDKTKWYTITDKTLVILQKDEASAETDIPF